MLSRLPLALTIAGLDPSGGAGVLADVRTFAAFGFHASAAITSITFQNRVRVLGAVHQSGETVRAQVMPLLADQNIVCSKTGMLPTRDVVREVARLFRENELPPPVVDPVMISTSGRPLMDADALSYMIGELLPQARLITPNIPEAEKLARVSITSESDMRQAAAIIRGLGATAVLIKGGHLGQVTGSRRQEADASIEVGENEELTGTFAPPTQSIDVLDDEGKVTVFRQPRIVGGELHGSGCILSAAVAAGIGNGMTLEASVGAAKKFVWEAIRRASGDFSPPSAVSGSPDFKP